MEATKEKKDQHPGFYKLSYKQTLTTKQTIEVCLQLRQHTNCRGTKKASNLVKKICRWFQDFCIFGSETWRVRWGTKIFWPKNLEFTTQPLSQSIKTRWLTMRTIAKIKENSRWSFEIQSVSVENTSTHLFRCWTFHVAHVSWPLTRKVPYEQWPGFRFEISSQVGWVLHPFLSYR